MSIAIVFKSGIEKILKQEINIQYWNDLKSLLVKDHARLFLVKENQIDLANRDKKLVRFFPSIVIGQEIRLIDYEDIKHGYNWENDDII